MVILHHSPTCPSRRPKNHFFWFFVPAEVCGYEKPCTMYINLSSSSNRPWHGRINAKSHQWLVLPTPGPWAGEDPNNVHKQKVWVPLVAVLFCLSCHICPVISVLIWPSCSRCPSFFSEFHVGNLLQICGCLIIVLYINKEFELIFDTVVCRTLHSSVEKLRYYISSNLPLRRNAPLKTQTSLPSFRLQSEIIVFSILFQSCPTMWITSSATALCGARCIFRSTYFQFSNFKSFRLLRILRTRVTKI